MLCTDRLSEQADNCGFGNFFTNVILSSDVGGAVGGVMRAHRLSFVVGLPACVQVAIDLLSCLALKYDPISLRSPKSGQLVQTPLMDSERPAKELHKRKPVFKIER